MVLIMQKNCHSMVGIRIDWCLWADISRRGLEPQTCLKMLQYVNLLFAEKSKIPFNERLKTKFPIFQINHVDGHYLRVYRAFNAFYPQRQHFHSNSNFRWNTNGFSKTYHWKWNFLQVYRNYSGFKWRKWREPSSAWHPPHVTCRVTRLKLLLHPLN